MMTFNDLDKDLIARCRALKRLRRSLTPGEQEYLNAHEEQAISRVKAQFLGATAEQLDAIVVATKALNLDSLYERLLRVRPRLQETEYPQQFLDQNRTIDDLASECFDESRAAYRLIILIEGRLPLWEAWYVENGIGSSEDSRKNQLRLAAWDVFEALADLKAFIVYYEKTMKGLMATAERLSRALTAQTSAWTTKTDFGTTYQR